MMEYYEHKLDPVGTRPEWLDDDDRYDFLLKEGGFWGRGGLFCYEGWDFDEESIVTAIRIPASHWAVPALKAGKVPVRGGNWPEGLTPELAVRMIALCRGVVEAGGLTDLEAFKEARAILAELEPIDPVAEAIKEAGLSCQGYRIGRENGPRGDAIALRETLAKHNLKIVEA